MYKYKVYRISTIVINYIYFTLRNKNLESRVCHFRMNSYLLINVQDISYKYFTLNSCLLANGSHRSFSMFPPTTNVVTTTPMSTQEKMKLKPTELTTNTKEIKRNISGHTTL